MLLLKTIPVVSEYIELGNPQNGAVASNFGDFRNIISSSMGGYYYSGTTVASSPTNAWAFSFFQGYQNINGNKYGNSINAIAVLDGDVSVSAVPLPGSILFFGFGFIGLFAVRRRKKANNGLS